MPDAPVTVGVTLPGEAFGIKFLDAWMAWWKAATPEQQQKMIDWYIQDMQRARDLWGPLLDLLVKLMKVPNA